MIALTAMLAAGVGSLSAYNYAASLRGSANERDWLDRRRLKLGQILRLLDAPDVSWLLTRRPRARRRLFLELSPVLRQDVVGLGRRSESFRLRLLVSLFLIGYHLMRFKSACRCGCRDLRFLAGLELAILRIEGIGRPEGGCAKEGVDEAR